VGDTCELGKVHRARIKSAKCCHAENDKGEHDCIHGQCSKHIRYNCEVRMSVAVVLVLNGR
jgi:hypothetical protein